MYLICVGTIDTMFLRIFQEVVLWRKEPDQVVAKEEIMVLRGALFNGADVIMFIFWEKNLKGS